MSYKVKSVSTAAPNRFRTFEDLEVYKAAREFRKKMYEVARQLPDFEKYALGDQVRRAAVSSTNNIAEGHGRYHFADQVKFFLASRGSLQELIDDLNTCEDEPYVEAVKIGNLKGEGWHVLSLLNGYLRYVRNRKLDSTAKVREIPETFSSEDEAALLLVNEALSSFEPI